MVGLTGSARSGSTGVTFVGGALAACACGDGAGADGTDPAFARFVDDCAADTSSREPLIWGAGAKGRDTSLLLGCSVTELAKCRTAGAAVRIGKLMAGSAASGGASFVCPTGFGSTVLTGSTLIWALDGPTVSCAFVASAPGASPLRPVTCGNIRDGFGRFGRGVCGTIGVCRIVGLSVREL